MRIRSRAAESEDINPRRLKRQAVDTSSVAPRAIRRDNQWPGLAGMVSQKQMGLGSVGTGNIEDRAVQAPQLDDWSVTEPKLADNSVTSPKVPTGALDARTLAAGSVTLPKFAQGTQPVQIVDDLPVDPLNEFTPGTVVVNTDDWKVYRLRTDPSGWDKWAASDDTWDAQDDDWPSGVWTAEVDTFDLRGLIEEGQIGEGAVVANTVAANAIGATQLAAIEMEVGKFIRSFNWDPGVAGWAIDGDGNAEFNDATFRGNIAASSVTSGQLVSSNYSAGSDGWALDASGNAELNDATFRGNIVASSVSSGQLVSSNYSAGSQGWALDSNGNVEFNDGTFRGNLQAAGGTFHGSLDASGTVSGADIRTSGTRAIRMSGDAIRFGHEGAADGRMEAISNFALAATSERIQLRDGPSRGVEWDIQGSPTQDYFRPLADDDILLGHSSRRWSSVWAVNGTVQTSDRRAKKHIHDLDRSKAVQLARTLRPKGYRMASERDDAPEHFGFDAAEIKQAADALGLSFAGVYDPHDDPDLTVPAPDPVYDDEGVQVNARPDPDDVMMGLNYAELIPLLWEWVGDLEDRMEAASG